MEDFVNQIPFGLFLGMFCELFLWKFTRTFMAKKCHYDCDKCEDWSCQKHWCEEKRRKYLKR